MEMTVKPICRAPLKAACIGGSPCSMKRWMFSITTMASSTTNPTQMVTAIRERLSMLKWQRYMKAKVPASASGTVMLAMNVGQNRRRNRKMTITTRAMLSRRENCTSCTEARMVVVRSLSLDQFDRRRDPLLELGQDGADAVHGLNHVGIRLLEDDDQHGAVGAGPARHARVFSAVDGPAESVELDRRIAALGQDQVLVSLAFQQLVVADQRVGEPVAVEAALGRIHVHPAQERAHVLQAQAGRGQRAGVDLDADGGFVGAADDGLADPFDLAQPLADDGVAVFKDLRRAAGCPTASPGS